MPTWWSLRSTVPGVFQLSSGRCRSDPSPWLLPVPQPPAGGQKRLKQTNQHVWKHAPNQRYRQLFICVTMSRDGTTAVVGSLCLCVWERPIDEGKHYCMLPRHGKALINQCGAIRDLTCAVYTLDGEYKRWKMPFNDTLIIPPQTTNLVQE